jgi:hypothetical protein
MKEIRIPHIRQVKITFLQNGDRPASVAPPRSPGRIGFAIYQKGDEETPPDDLVTVSKQTSKTTNKESTNT